MKFKQLLAVSMLSGLAATSQATMITFDDALKNGNGTILSGTGGTTTGSGDIYGTTLGFGDFNVTSGYSNGFNLASGQFNISNITFASTSRVYQDLTPSNGGLGAYTGSGRPEDSDNLNSNLGNGSGYDEVLFFDYSVNTILDTVWFNGEHTELTQDNGTSSLNGDSMFNIFASTDGITYKTLLVGGQMVPTDRDFINITLGDSYKHFAVAASGYGDTKGYVEAIKYTAVPEPGTLALLGLGLAGFVVSRKKKGA